MIHRGGKWVCLGESPKISATLVLFPSDVNVTRRGRADVGRSRIPRFVGSESTEI